MLEDERRRGREGGKRERFEVLRTSKAPATSKRKKCAQRRREIQTAAPGADRPLHSVSVKRPLVALVADQTAGEVNSGAERGVLVTDPGTSANGQKGGPQNRRRDEYFDHAEFDNAWLDL